MQSELAASAPTRHVGARGGKRSIRRCADRTDAAGISASGRRFTVTREPRPNRCSGYLRRRKALPIALHAVTPGHTPVAATRGSTRSRATPAGAAIVRDSDAVEGAGHGRQCQLRRSPARRHPYALRGRKVVRGSTWSLLVSFDGAGSLILQTRERRAAETLIKETPDVAWGGIRGAHRLRGVTIRAMIARRSKRAKGARAPLPVDDGVGAPLTLTIIPAHVRLRRRRGRPKRTASRCRTPASSPRAPCGAMVRRNGGVHRTATARQAFYVRGAPLSHYVRAPTTRDHASFRANQGRRWNRVRDGGRGRPGARCVGRSATRRTSLCASCPFFFFWGFPRRVADAGLRWTNHGARA